MMRRTRWLRVESGMSLPEVMIVVAIITVVTGFVLTAMASLQKEESASERRLENLDEARILMDTVTKDVRTGVRLGETSSPFLAADDNDVTFYANLNLTSPCPKLVHLYVDPSQRLVEQVTDPNAGGVPPTCLYTGAAHIRLVGRYIVNSASQPVFTYYYDNAGTPVAFTTSATPLSAANLLLVDAVGIRFSIRKSTSLVVAPTTLVNRVRLPNVDYNPLPTTSP